MQALEQAQARGAPPERIQEIVTRIQHEEEYLSRVSPGASELEYAESPWMASVTGTSGARFLILRSEATLRNHGAPYEYSGGGGGVAMGGAL
jgi:hypothetical protein